VELQNIAAAQGVQPAAAEGIGAAAATAPAVAVSPQLIVHREFRANPHVLREAATGRPDLPATGATPLRAAGTDRLVAGNSRSGAMLAVSRFRPERIGPMLGDLPVIAAPAAPPVMSDGFSISVEVCLVHLRRSWLADGLLNLKSWFVPTVTKGSFSDGTGRGNSTPLAVLPIACVFIRNLAIKARWTDEDRARAETSSHLGTFALLGRSFDQNSATLTTEGMQAIAWICQPMPVLPPRDAPE
jgi:hypothetical protein